MFLNWRWIRGVCLDAALMELLQREIIYYFSFIYGSGQSFSPAGPEDPNQGRVPLAGRPWTAVPPPSTTSFSTSSLTSRKLNERYG